jgi:hypothetical protein
MIRHFTDAPIQRRMWAGPGMLCLFAPIADLRGRIASGIAGAGGGGGAP